MSRQHINAYRTKLANIFAASGSLNEGSISQAFATLIESWGRSHDLHLVQQWEGKGPRGNNIRVDGAMVPSVLRIPFGYWEAKDSKDDLDREIAAKIASGYPDDNIIYENSVTAVLRQNGKEVDRAPLQGDDDALLHLLNKFFAYERAEIAEFRRAAEQFRTDLPQILEALRMAIGEAEARSSDFARALKDFLDHAHQAINRTVTAEDVREMLIQHILTEEIFASVFDNAQYHRENNVAKRLGELEAKFFTGALRHQTTERLRPYYAAIKGAAADIANPPYNAWQQDYNARNPNRPYKRVDDRIGQTYRARSNAQNTVALNDMYVRFWRWASDRLRGDGVIAFVTNRNYIDKVSFDGFRKSIAEEFAEAWVMDLGGDVRANPKLSGTTHNVFGIQTGVAICFLVRDKSAKGFKLSYARRPEDDTARNKLAFLEDVQDFDRWEVAPLKPDAKGNWLSTDHPDWAGFLPLADPTKGPGDGAGRVDAIFRLTSNGTETGRDEWLWAWSKRELQGKVRYFIKSFNEALKSGSDGSGLKLDRQLDKIFRAKRVLEEHADSYRCALSRPFISKHLYFDKDLNAYLFRLPSMYDDASNPTIMQLGIASQAPFSALATDKLFDFGVLKTGNGRTQGVTRYRYNSSGERLDNITDWALKQFRARYEDEVAAARFAERTGNAGIAQTITQPDGTVTELPIESGPVAWPNVDGVPTITKDAIFAYCYAVLHDPIYREIFAADLRREFPRIPLYDDFLRWHDWGRALLELHIGYEKAKHFKFNRVDSPTKMAAVPKLRSEPDKGLVIVDSETQLTGIPEEAWNYRLGNRSAIDWVLDQHKEKTPRDPTVRAKFNTYRFADHKEEMIKLLARVMTVGLQTVKITEAMRALERSENATRK